MGQSINIILILALHASLFDFNKEVSILYYMSEVVFSDIPRLIPLLIFFLGGTCTHLQSQLTKVTSPTKPCLQKEIADIFHEVLLIYVCLAVVTCFDCIL